MKILRLLLLVLLLGSLIASATIAQPFTPYDSHETDTDTEDSEEDTEDSDDETDTEEDEHEDEHEDSDEDGIDDDTEAAFEREVEIEQDDREFKVKSELKNGENKDEFESEFKVGGGDEPELKFKYSSEAGSTETEMKYRVNFDELIEFTDDGVPGYQEDNDTVVSIYELDKADWESIVYSTETVGDSTVYTASVQTTDGVFKLILKISTSIAQLNSTVITPNAVKIDVVINGFDYQGNDTYLSLQTDIKTETESEYEEESEDEEHGFAQNESQVSVGGSSTASDAATGFFSWVKTAEADGTVIDVLSSDFIKDVEDDDDDLEEGEQKGIIYFTFDAQNPDKIVWDPKVGVSNDAVISEALARIQGSGSPDAALPFPFLALLFAMAIPVWVRRRRQ